MNVRENWKSRIVIRILYRMTAKAFGQTQIHSLSSLSAYAKFTQEQMYQLSGSDIKTVQKRMYQYSFQIGNCIRKLLCIRSDDRAQKVLFWLYQNIGISMNGTCPGSVSVNNCYFSQYYTPAMCKIMSAMDKGMFAGILGGGKLSFEERITEGYPCCKAMFTAHPPQNEPLAK